MKIIFFVNHQVSLRSLLKNSFQTTIVTQLIIMHPTSDSPTTGFTQGAQLILSVTCALNFSGYKFNQSFNNFFFSLIKLKCLLIVTTTNMAYFMVFLFKLADHFTETY